VPVVTGLARVGVVSVRLDARLVELIDPAVLGIAFNTDDTYIDTVVIKSPEVAPVASVTVVPLVAVKSAEPSFTPLR
jgi:hypothetical protein